jgi:hypothetical protein
MRAHRSLSVGALDFVVGGVFVHAERFVQRHHVSSKENGRLIDPTIRLAQARDGHVRPPPAG